MAEQHEAPTQEAGWYPDPERAHTLRYWDGKSWTEDRAPVTSPTASTDAASTSSGSGWTSDDGRLTSKGRYGIGVIIAAVGALIAIVGVFLPMVDTESSLHIAKNSLIQHWEGPVALCVALAGALAALHPSTRPLAFLAGGGLVLLAVLAGTNLPVDYRNELSRNVADDASPGAGIWTLGVGGAILALSALFADWTTLGRASEQSPASGRSRMERFEELMSGQEAPEAPDPEDGSQEVPEDLDERWEEPANAPRPKGRRMRRFEELMSGRPLPDPEEHPDSSSSSGDAGDSSGSSRST